MIPQETLTRRELLKAGIATFIAACAPSVPSVDQKAASVISSASPAGRISVETAKPLELPDQARNIVLDRWLSLLNSPQRESENGYDTFLDIHVKNMEGWKRNIPSVFTNQGSSADDPMKASWISGQSVLTYAGWNALKFTGEMEIKEVRVVLTDQRGTGKPDDNGFQWSGEFRLDSRARSHVNNYSFGEINKNQASLMSWLAAPETNPFPDFSPWQGESLYAKLVLQKGVWSWGKDPFKYDISTGTGPRGILDNLSLPSTALYQGGQSGCKSYDSCKQIRMPAFK